jgi:signal transduction histidine kinase
MLEADIPRRAHEDYEAAVAEVHRLSRLVDGLLMLARAENRPSARERTDVFAIVSGRRAAWLPLAEERHVNIAIEGRLRAFALVTRGNLEQVLDNLIANAIDVSPENTTISLRIEPPTAEREGRWTTVHVIDQGPGMSLERRVAAFDRSWRVGDSEGTIGGFGLGLAIVRQLVVTDRGEVELLEAEGGGLDVCVHLSATTAPRRRPIVVRRLEGDGSPEDGETKASPKARVGQLVSN